ncbi:hypothetical protein NBCG_04032 [Nocardioidaceae bacterium Broad-1]|nr:hypothetical protein NBCG_04032 [Nocardioidaceae bacterium Broad-1]
MALSLEVVTESWSAKTEHVTPDFEHDPRFDSSWWHAGSAKSPVSYCRFLDDGDEVARAKVLPRSGEYRGYTSWSCPQGGVTEIDLIEVRNDLRKTGQRYGTRAVDLIGQHFGRPIVAMSLDETSDPFWGSLAWTPHTHPDDNDPQHSRYRTLFSSI